MRKLTVICREVIPAFLWMVIHPKHTFICMLWLLSVNPGDHR